MNAIFPSEFTPMIPGSRTARSDGDFEWISVPTKTFIGFFSRMDILTQATLELSGRGLLCAAKWMAEQDLHVHSTLQTSLPISPTTPSPKPNSQDFKLFNLANCMFQCREYDRVAHLLQGLTNKKCIFMRLYAKYLVRKSAFLLLKSVIT